MSRASRRLVTLLRRRGGELPWNETASPVQNALYDHNQDGQVKWVFEHNSAGNTDFTYRRVDASNWMIVSATSAGQLVLYKTGWSMIALVASVFTNGQEYEMVVTFSGDDHAVSVNGTEHVNETVASSPQGVKATYSGASQSSLFGYR